MPSKDLLKMESPPALTGPSGWSKAGDGLTVGDLADPFPFLSLSVPSVQKRAGTDASAATAAPPPVGAPSHCRRGCLRGLPPHSTLTVFLQPSSACSFLCQKLSASTSLGRSNYLHVWSPSRTGATFRHSVLCSSVPSKVMADARGCADPQSQFRDWFCL